MNDDNGAGVTFESCINRCIEKDGELTIACKRGLWVICSMNHVEVERGARHYWQQYFNDGEYN